MKKALLTTALSLSLAGAAWADQHGSKAEHAPKPAAAPVENVEKHEHKPHWGYTGKHGASHWGDLSTMYETCKAGMKQSPIDISQYLQEDIPALNFTYNPVPLEVLNNGHTVQVNYAAGSTLSSADKTFNLLQFHFHTPSEHYIDGAPYPMEVHFVHKAEDGTRGIVGVMMKVGKHNPIIEGIWQNVPPAGETKAVESVKLSAADLLPANKQYYKYEGSLATPPCSEGVQWHVMKDPIEISAEQLKAFQAVFPVNARPIQSLNDRVITGQ